MYTFLTSGEVSIHAESFRHQPQITNLHTMEVKGFESLNIYIWMNVVSRNNVLPPSAWVSTLENF